TRSLPSFGAGPPEVGHGVGGSHGFVLPPSPRLNHSGAIADMAVRSRRAPRRRRHGKGGAGMKRLMQVIGAVVVVLGVSVGVTTAAGASSGLEIAGRVRESHGDDFSHGHEVDEHYALETDSG